MSTTATVTVDLPDLLFGTFQVVTHGHLKIQEETIHQIICGLSDLSGADMRSLPDPPDDAPNWEFRIDLERRYLERLLEVSRQSQMDIGSIFRRIFFALITEKVRFLTPQDTGDKFRIELTQKLRARRTNPASRKTPKAIPTHK